MEYTEVPIVRLEHLSPAQARALMIADNRLTENSQWDSRLLAENFKELAELDLDFSLDVTGFEIPEIDLIIEGLNAAPTEGPDPADQIPQPKNPVQVTRAGDLWLLGRNRLLCGSALDSASFALLMDGRKAALGFTDPPYNVQIDGHATGLGQVHHREFQMGSGEMTEGQFTKFLKDAFALMAEWSRGGSIHFVFMDWRHLSELLAAGRQSFSEFKNLCVWVKDNGGMGSLYRSQHELISVFKSGKERHRNNVQLGQYGRYRSNVWSYPGVNSFSRSTEEGNLLQLHPTVKPVALVADAILDCSARGDIVLDPFLGSGTTIIAAEKTGRICYGVEIDPVYVDTIIRRWQAFTGNEAIHVKTGKRFNHLESETSNALQQ